MWFLLWSAYLYPEMYTQRRLLVLARVWSLVGPPKAVVHVQELILCTFESSCQRGAEKLLGCNAKKMMCSNDVDKSPLMIDLRVAGLLGSWSEKKKKNISGCMRRGVDASGGESDESPRND